MYLQSRALAFNPEQKRRMKSNERVLGNFNTQNLSPII